MALVGDTAIVRERNIRNTVTLMVPNDASDELYSALFISLIDFIEIGLKAKLLYGPPVMEPYEFSDFIRLEFPIEPLAQCL